jgi:cytochrome c1
MLLKILLLCCLSFGAWADEEVKLDKVNVATDIATIQKGANDLMGNCHTCHTIKYVNYHDLVQLGIPKETVNGWRGDAPMDSPLVSQMPDEALMQSFNKIPPDLSLMAQARDGGPNYLYSYLLGYYNKPDGTLANHIFSATKMPDVLGVTGATDDAQRAAVKIQAHDIVSFLAWTADPHENDRKRLGCYVLAYLVVLTTLLYFVKKQVWGKLQ